MENVGTGLFISNSLFGHAYIICLRFFYDMGDHDVGQWMWEFLLKVFSVNV